MNLMEEISVETDLIVLGDKLREATHQLAQACNQNERLVNALYEARGQERRFPARLVR